MIIDKVIDFSLLPLGIAIFILGQVYSFYVERVENISDEKEKNILAKLAFIDILTGINNRTKCEMLFEEYEKKYESITIVNFDIDNFKYINDNLGHTMGDKAIKDIATLLKKTFYNIGEVGRMGGDEFIVILEGNSVKKIKDALEYFLDLLDEYNKSDEIELEISVSYGYGSRKNREEKNITEVYEESDKNMYLCKNNKKEYSKV
nr:GGDEF domain-containing protein [Clostridium sp. MSJ-8]